MKKILGLLIMLACLISCNEKITIPIDGEIVSIKEYNRDADVIVFKVDNGDLYEVKADDEAMDKYYFQTQQHVRMYLLSNNDTTVFDNIGIEPIK